MTRIVLPLALVCLVSALFYGSLRKPPAPPPTATPTVLEPGKSAEPNKPDLKTIEAWIEEAKTATHLGEFAKAAQLHGMIAEALPTELWERAIEHYGLAIALRKTRGEAAQVALLLYQRGNLHSHQKNYDPAWKDFQEALDGAIRTGNRPLEAKTLIQLGIIRQNLGDLALARERYTEALDVLGGTVGSEDTKIHALYRFERLELIEGNFEEASRLLERVQEILQLAPGAGTQAKYQAELSWLELVKERYEEALDASLRALADHQNLKPKERILLWDQLGSILVKLKLPDESLLAFQEALRLAREARWGEREILINLCDLSLEFPELGLTAACPEAETSLERTLDPNRKAGLYWQKARYLDSLGRWEEALEASGKAVDYLDLLRSSIQGRNRRERFLHDRSDFFRFRIGQFMAAHRRSPRGSFDSQALEASERLRARSLLELWAESEFDFLASAEPGLLAEFEKSMDELRELEARRDEKGVEEKISTALARLDILDQELRESSPLYRQLPRPGPMRLSEIQAHLEEGTAAIDLILDDNESYLFVLEKHQLRSFLLPARKEIEATAADFLSLLGDPNATGRRGALWTSGTRLARLLWGEREERLEGLPRKLLFLGDGTLQPFPLAALPRLEGDSEQPTWLIESHEIVHLPSLSMLDALAGDSARQQPTRDAILVGDPLYRLDLRSSTGLLALEPGELARLYPHLSPRPALGRLPFSDLEVSRLSARFGQGAIELATGPRASRQRVLSPEIQEFSIVHLSSHGFLDPEHVELSALLLSEIDERGEAMDGHLRLQDLYRLKLRADLVVASACQTGVGGEVRLEGVHGLTQGFFHAGARRALVSLWRVESETTAILMDYFYEHLLAGQPPSTALRMASLRLMKDAENRRVPWSAPFFWAPFILVGDPAAFELPSERKSLNN